MRESERRIQLYKARLPRIRERIIATLMVFAFSIIMMTMSAFAWVTLSIAPEMSGMKTTIAANGNLEVALVNGVKREPAPSAIGDGAIDNLLARNVTWGNLINLSHPSYGLDHLTLRPAAYSDTLGFYTTNYDASGRVFEEYVYDFAYSQWNSKEEFFEVITSDDAYGVRALTSYIYDDPNADKAFNTLMAAVSSNLSTATNQLDVLDSNKNYMDSIAKLMGVYLTARFNSGQDPDCKNYIDPMYNMIGDLVETMDTTGKAIVAILEMYQMKAYGREQYSPYTVDSLYTAVLDNGGNVPKAIDDIFAKLDEIGTIDLNDAATLAQIKAFKDEIKQYVADRKLLKEDYETHLSFWHNIAVEKKQSVLWSSRKDASGNDYEGSAKIKTIETIINDIVKIASCEVSGKRVDKIGKDEAAGMLGKQHTGFIREGLLSRMAARIGAIVNAENITITAKYIITVDVTAKNVFANVKDDKSANVPEKSILPSQFIFARDTLSGAQNIPTNAVAADTFGLAVDFWVRTNANSSYLTLDGEYIVEYEDDIRTINKRNANGDAVTDAEGNPLTTEVKMYLANMIIPSETEGEEPLIEYGVELYLYKPEDAAEEAYYVWDTHALVSLDQIEEGSLMEKKFETIVGYTGSNRIWQGESANLLPEFSTSQGMGSCYTFYLDNPADQDKILSVLQHLKIAFLDENGKKMASASLNTEPDKCFLEYGKVTVPIMLDTSSYSITNEFGEAVYVITELERAKPTLITMLVYLDGAQLSNENVLSSSEIEGKINMQFASTFEMKAVNDEDLYYETRIASATFEDGSIEATVEYDKGSKPQKNILVKIDGAQPLSVKASFIRKISATQGARQEEIEFVQQSDGTWLATATFDSPGEYILRTLLLDGIDYDLKPDENGKFLTFKINGFTLSSLTTSYTSGSVIMTADNSVEDRISLVFKTDDRDKMPSNVRAVFLGEGNQVSANLSYDSASNSWTGFANFVRGGNYKMEYVIFDGQFYYLDESMRKEYDIYLGLRTRIWLDEDPNLTHINEKFDPSVGSYAIPLGLVVLDGDGEEMLGLPNVVLRYAPSGGIEFDDTTMRWDEDRQCYTGSIAITNPGTYTFRHLMVGESTISSAVFAPTISFIPPEPIRYNSNETIGYQFVPDGGAKMQLTFLNAESATVYAKLYNTYTGKFHVVQGTKSSVQGSNATMFTFAIPNNADGKQDGHWQIMDVKATNIKFGDNFYAGGGVLTDQTFDAGINYISVPLGDTTVTTKAVQNIKPSYIGKHDAVIELGREGNTLAGAVNAEFLTAHTIGGAGADSYSMKLCDFEGKAIETTITNVKFVFDRRNVASDTKTYGGYTTSLGGDDALEIITINFAQDATDKTLFTSTNSGKLMIAGRYETKVYYTLADLNKEISVGTYSETKIENFPVYNVWSNPATVKITAISSNASGDRYYPTSTPSSKTGILTGSYNKLSADGYSATVYMYVSAKSGLRDTESLFVKKPTVTLALTGVPTTHQGVTMVFPSGNDETTTFSFAAGGTSATASIGAGEDGTYNTGVTGLGFNIETWPIFYPAGKQTVKTVTVQHSNATFAVDLTHDITINNPQSPPYVEFKDIKSIDSTFTGTTPSRVYSEDGETITLTLPTIASWSYTQVDNTPGAETLTSDNTDVVYTTASASWGRKTYTYYNRNVKVYTSVGISKSYLVTKQIVGWKVNGIEYKPGDTITVTGNQTVTAVIKTTNGAKTTETTTVTRTVTTFTATGKTSTGYWADEGSEVSSVTNTETTTSTKT